MPKHSAIAAIQIGGAGAGALGAVIWAAVGQNAGASGLIAWIFLAFAMVAGVLLWDGRPIGVPLSLLVWLLQVCGVSGDGAVFRFLAGVGGGLRFSAKAVTLYLEAGGVAQVDLFSGDAVALPGASINVFYRISARGAAYSPYFIQANILAIVVSILLFRAWVRQGSSRPGSSGSDQASVRA